MPWETSITVEDTTYPVRFNTESEPTQADIDEAVAMIMQQRSTPAAEPAADQPGRLGSFASSVGRGALSVIPGTVGGVGYALGSDTLTGAADTIEGGINRMLPVNPGYQDEFLMKGGQAFGQALGMVGTGGLLGAAGKGLALSRGLAQGAAAAKGADLAKNVLLGTGIAQGIRGGGQEAEKYGLQGGSAYARALLGGAIEGASERYLFGMGTELAPVKKFLGDAAEKGVGGIVKAAGTEAGEEAAAQIGGNVATSILAPYGVQTPGAFEGAGEAALLGGIAGGTIGGINALIQPSPTIEGEVMVPPAGTEPPVTAAQEPEDDFGLAAFQQEIEQIVQNPDPIVPLQQTINQAAVTSVTANANLLPATAAVIESGGLAPAPTPVAAQPAPAPQPTREEQLAQLINKARLRQSANERADMEQQLAQVEDEGVLADVFAEERRKAVQREDFLRRQRDLEDERQRLADQGILEDVFAEERQKAISREQSKPEPSKDFQTGETSDLLPEGYSIKHELKNGKHIVSVFDSSGNRVGTGRFVEKGDNIKYEPGGILYVEPEHRRRGIASAIYAKAEEKTGKKLLPSANLTGQGAAFEANRKLTREQPEPEPPVVEETTPPEQPIPAVEEAPAAKITSEEVPNVENVIDEPGAAEVGSGMEETEFVPMPGVLPGGDKPIPTAPKAAYEKALSILRSKTDNISLIDMQRVHAGVAAGLTPEEAVNSNLKESGAHEAARTAVATGIKEGRIEPGIEAQKEYDRVYTETLKPQTQPAAEKQAAETPGKKGRALPTFSPTPKEPFKPSAERFTQFYVDEGIPEATAAKNGAKLMQVVETGEWSDILRPDNVKSRAIWETWTGKKLPKGLAASKAAVAEFVAEYRAENFTTPASELSDTELDAEILRLAEQGMKPSASQTLKDRALELSKEFQLRQETGKAKAEDSSIKTRRAAIARKALAFTGGRGTVGNLAGDSFAQMRADLLSEITGTKVAKAKAGINALMKAFYQEFGIASDTEAGMQKKLAQALQEAVAPTTAPAPQAEQPAPQRDTSKLEQMTPEERGRFGHQEVIELAKQDYELAKTGQTWGYSGGQNYKSKAAAVKDTKEQLDKASNPTESDIKRGASDHYGEVNKALADQKPVSKAAVDAYGITLPEGYVAEGDLYVYRPGGEVKAAPAPTEGLVSAWTRGARERLKYDPEAKSAVEEFLGEKLTEDEIVAFVVSSADTLNAKEKGALAQDVFSAIKQEGYAADLIRAEWEKKKQTVPQKAVAEKEPKEAPAPAPTSENLEEKKRTRLGKLLGDANRKEGSPSRIEMLDEARALWKTEKEYRYNGLIRLRDDITTLIQSSLGTDTVNSKKIAEALIEGRPNLADKIASLAPVKQAEMTNAGAYPSTLTGFGYERGGRGVYTHPNAPSKEFGSTNATISTPEGYQATRKRVAKKIGGQTNIGGMLDPVLLKDIIAIGAFYLEGGARSFASFSAKMIEDLGEGVRKYIQPAYDELRKRTDIDTTGMDPVEGMETAPVAEAPTAPAKVEAEAPKAAPAQAAPKPATESFPTEISLTEQPERSQAPVVPPDNKPVGFSNAEMDAEAARIVGRELVRPVQEAISDEALWAQATAEFKRDSDSGRRLVSSLVSKPRVVSSKEQAMIGMELVRRKNALNEAATKFLTSPEGDVGAKSEYETAQREYDDAMYANSIAGSDVGRALRFRRLMANLDMELESMLSNLKAVGNKAELSKEQVAEVTKISEESKTNSEKIDALRKKAESSETTTDAEYLEVVRKAAFEEGRQAAKKEIEEQAKADAAKVAEMQKRKAEYLAAKKEAAKTPNKWEEIRAAARARNAELRSNLYSDVVLVKAASMAVNDVIIGATYIAEGVTKFTDWVSKMRSEGINLTDDEMQQLFKESKAFDAGEGLPASEAPLKTRKTKAPAIDKVKAIAADEEQLDSRTVYNLVVEKMKTRIEDNPALEKVEMSEADLTNIISEVTEDVQEFFPGITEREIRDLFSGYGIILKPSSADIAKQMRQLTALGRLQSAIEDAEAKRAPLKSGPQRDKATQAIRLQQKKLARELRMMGREYEAGEEQLRSPLDAIKARLRNQIDDLAFEINTRKKIARRPATDYDPEAKELADLRDELKRISDFINAPAGPTFAELVQDEKDKLDKRIGDLEKALENPQLMSKPDRQLYTQELQVKRDKRDALNGQLRKLRKIEADKSRTQEDIDKAAVESVKESIKELQRKIDEKDFARPERRTPTETAEYLALVAQKEALQDQIKAKRLELFGRQGMSDEQRIKMATAAIDKSIERMQKMLTSGNYDTPKRVSKTPETPELAQKREDRKALRKRILELKKLKREAEIDPIAKQIATDKKRIQTRMKKLKERMDKGDFSKPAKREKPTDPELLELLAKEEKLKERWGEMLLNHKLSQRSRAKRYWDNVFDLFSMGRFLKASTDLSAIANQGNFALFSHPVLSMRQLGGMWKAMQSDTNQKIINAKIRELPEYKSGEMKRAGLYLSLDAGPNDPLQRQEEAMASRWVDKIPKRYGGGILRATSRAYTTYLDLIRVATYLSLKNNLVEGGWFMQPQETTPERLQSVANLINNGTGRGSLGSGRFGAGMSQAAPFLNTFLFAPRFGVSRFAMALGIPLWTASKGTKVLIAKEYTKYIAGLTTAMILYSMFQDEDDKEMEFDPTSSDFGKVLFNNQRLDIMGGFQQPLVFLLRLLFGEYKNSKGQIKPLREGDRPLNLFRDVPRTDKPKFTDRSGAVVVGDFLRYKLSPTASLLLNSIQGKTPVGERTDFMSEVLTLPVPLITGQVAETLEAQQDDPFMAALLTGSGIIGFRTSNQDPKEDRDKAKTTWEQLIDYTKQYSGVK
jgi:GNAT superfamily N-acetyltransferase